MKIVSLFSGAGGLDLGLIQAGNDVIWANDIDKDAVATYKQNIGENIICADIKNIEISAIPKADVVVGGFPCQGFSQANMRRALDDPRNQLYKFFYETIKTLQPKFFIAENVKGILSIGKGEAIKQIISDFQEAGYNTEIHKVNMADYGVPQTRQRVIIIGQNKALGESMLFRFPQPTNGKDGIPKPWVTIREAIDHFPDPDICDVDLPKKDTPDYSDRYGYPEEFFESPFPKKKKKSWQSFLPLIVIVTLALYTDYYVGNGACYYVLENWGLKSEIAIGAAVVALMYGWIFTDHRTFMHSLLAGAIFSGSLYIFCEPLAKPFMIGFLMHILLDLLNKKGEQLLWPLKWRPCFNLCASDGKVDHVLGTIGFIASVILFPYFFINCMFQDEKILALAENLKNTSHVIAVDLPLLFRYLFVMNTLGFLAYVIDYIIYKIEQKHGGSGYNNYGIRYTITQLLQVGGGALGALIALIILNKGKVEKGDGGNTATYVDLICLSIVWTSIYVFVINPFGFSIDTNPSLQFLGKYHVPIIFFMIINVITFILLICDKNRQARQGFKPLEILEIFLSFIGGATGAYLS